MQNNTIKSFGYSIPGISVGDKISIQTTTTARSIQGYPSSMQLFLNDELLKNIPYSSVSGSYDDRYASDPIKTIVDKIVNSDQINLTFNYNKSWNEAAAWIDYFVITVPRTIEFYGEQKIIRTQRSICAGMS